MGDHGPLKAPGYVTDEGPLACLRKMYIFGDLAIENWLPPQFSVALSPKNRQFSVTSLCSRFKKVYYSCVHEFST